ncbi:MULTISPECIES: FHA domain-containing protein [unclassified Micromonospora]|uniref:FHA domain-containing protein n=1 Tax=unclassified Micromonospora TaxID=2617518 RepID=UPI0033EF03BF
MDTELHCPRCGQNYPAETGYFCPKHPGEELVPAPAATDPVPAEAAPDTPTGAAPAPACWSCGARATDFRNDRCTVCHQSLVPPALVISFPSGSVVVPARRSSVELGRAGEHGHVFAGYPNVSRRHATVSVDEEGTAWITPFPEAPNGTFINGTEIHDRTRVRPGDQIRFATDREPHVGPISESIRQPDRDRQGPPARPA